MIMPPRLRALLLTAHVSCAVGSLGAVAAFLVLAVAGLTSADAQMVQGAYPAMDLIARIAILPLILAAFVTGVVQSLGTHWGLFRHYWVVAKLVLSVVVAIIVLMQMGLLGHLADAAATATFSSAEFLELRRSPVLHAAGGLLVLLLPVALSVYKPRGMTRYGWRKQHERAGGPG
jgi:uncharacterized membrane protein